MLEIENSLYKQGFKYIAGIDEAGRGPLAGPVCAAAVILPQGLEIEGINDSKKLSEKKREKLYEIIIQNAVAYSIKFVYQDVIDKINIKNATHTAMENALNDLKVKADFVIIDGNDRIEYKTPYQYIIKGDSKSQTIAAASILAKVCRDKLMCELDEKYPQYGFKQHKGYGTAAHCKAIQEFGISKIHRKTFMTDKVLGIKR